MSGRRRKAGASVAAAPKHRHECRCGTRECVRHLGWRQMGKLCGIRQWCLLHVSYRQNQELGTGASLKGGEAGPGGPARTRASAPQCGARGLSVVTLLAAMVWFTGCSRYAGFTLPALAGGDPHLSYTLELQAEPVLSPGATWDSHDVLNPSLVLFPQPLLLYSGFDGRTWRTGAATSPDGLRWQKQGMVLSPDSRTWEGSYIAANGSALIHEAEAWYWYVAGPREHPAIGLARSADGRTWRKEPRPVFETGPYLSWDEIAVADPYVLRIDPYFYLYYLGEDRARRQRIGLARSRDGVHWQKLVSNPVLDLGANGAFDQDGLGEPAVWQSKGYYWMLYTGRNSSENRRMGLARSTDGVQWQKLPTVFAGTASWNSKVVCDPEIANGGRVYFGGGDIASPDENLHGRIGVAVLHEVNATVVK